MSEDGQNHVGGMLAQPATPETEFDPRNPNRHRLMVVSEENASAFDGDVVERATLQERERCARVVENWEQVSADTLPGSGAIIRILAAAIRKGEA